MDLSIIIPAYNEEKRLPDTLETIFNYCNARRLQFEIIVVNDGSRDATRDVVLKKAARLGRITLLDTAGNRGKGFSVRGAAILEAEGREILFTDADLSTPIEEYEKLREALARGADIAIASRDIRGAQVERHQPWYREMMGKIFNQLMKLIVGLPFHDTQCGFKLFSREAARAVFPRLALDRFAFDVEILWVARKLGLETAEIPVRWVNSLQSRVNPLRDSSHMLLDLFRIRWNDLTKKYS